MFATDLSGQGDMVDYIIKPDSENAKFLKQLSNIKFKRQEEVRNTNGYRVRLYR